MTKWLHFTENPEQFRNGLQAIASDDPSAFVKDGLLVYRYYDDEQVRQHQRGWPGRWPVYIECDDAHVALYQPDPLGDDPGQDEYLIPLEHFGECRVL